MMLTKAALRQQYRQVRADFTAAYRASAAMAAATRFQQSALFQQSEHIACYLSMKNEFDTAPLINALWEAKKSCYVPVVSSTSKSLTFVPYRAGDALHLNRFGILEPAATSTIIAAHQLDLVVTPLLAFDRQGHRLGMGGGYYDHTFSFLREAAEIKSSAPLPYLLGLGYAAQEIAQLRVDTWDVPLRGVLTEREIIICT